jgi:hypothetical protein
MVINQFKRLEQHTRRGGQMHGNDMENMFSSSINQNPLETMNMNVGYLLSLIRLIDEYTIIEIARDRYETEVQYLNHLWRIIRSMYRLLSCKMDDVKRTDFKKRIFTDTPKQMQEVSQGANGEYVDNDKAFITESFIGEIFQDLVADMESRGMLTYKKENPMEAMGKFSD